MQVLVQDVNNISQHFCTEYDIIGYVWDDLAGKLA